MDAVVALTTAPNENEARHLANTFVESGLVACVNIVPAVESVYRWKEKLCRETECLLIMKTTRARIEQLKPKLVELHSHECPELIVLPITDGLPAYLAWLAKGAEHP